MEDRNYQYDANGGPPLQDVPQEERPPILRSQEKILLHGSLDVWIYQAKCLPNMDLFSEKLRQVFSVFDVCKAPFRKADSSHDARTHHRSKVITSDPYASVILAGARLARTRVITNNQDPVWNEHFVIPVAHFVSEIVFSVKDNDLMGAQLIGNLDLPAEDVVRGDTVEGWYDVTLNGKVVRPGAQLRLKVAYIPVDLNPLYRNVVSAGPDYHGTPNTYFPLRKGGKIELYHDAHVEDGTLPNFTLDNGKIFQHRKCWEDICTAILEAHHLVYIAGWSIYTQISLMRDTAGKKIRDGGDLTLGELLKRKSKEGVRVLLLVWDDKTSHNKALIKTVVLDLPFSISLAVFWDSSHF